jgi:hypothetical protein
MSKTLLYSFVAAGVMAIAVAAALALGPASTPPARAQAVCPENPSPPDAADPSMVVAEPVAGATVTSPVTISGQARTFEANVRLTIFDAEGNELADTFTTAAEAGPALAPFSTSVEFQVASEQPGCIRVFEESARDGSPVNVVQVEVQLASVVPPRTGSAGLAAADSEAR